MITITYLINQHIESLRPNTRKGYITLQNHLLDFAEGDTLVTDITPAFCQSFAQYLLTLMKPNSADTHLQKLHSLLQQCVLHGLLHRNPIRSVAALLPYYVVPERCFLLQEELHQLESTPCPHESTRLAFLFACHTGLRISDIETLRWCDIRQMGDRFLIVKIQVKTRHEVRIPLDHYATRILAEVRRQEGYDDKRPIFRLYSRTLVAQDLRLWGRAAGIKKHITFHVSRHTFATLMASSQCDIFVVSELCGHTSIRTTQIYARLIDQSRFQAIDRLDALFPLPCGNAS